MNLERIRLFATVNSGFTPTVRHILGFPAVLNTGARDPVALPSTEIAVLVSESPGGVFLYRLTRVGEPCGDTWHQNVDDAQHQASFEFGDALGIWREIPPEVEDPLEFALETVRSSSGGGL